MSLFISSLIFCLLSYRQQFHSRYLFFSFLFFFYLIVDNKSSEDRYVVIIDFWHPELSTDERTALDFVYDTRNKFETGKSFFAVSIINL